MANILIAGGSGFIGQALVADRLAKHDHVTVLGRATQKITNLFANQVKATTWSELSKDYLQLFDVIINLAGVNIAEKKWTNQQKQEIINSRVQTTQRLATLCAQLQDKSPRLFNASAIGIYGTQLANTPLISDEATILSQPPYPDFLTEVAQKWEHATDVAKQAGVKVVNLRFGVVLSVQGGMLKQLLTSFKIGLGAKTGTGKQILTWVSLADVINSIDFLLKHPDVKGPINIVSPNNVTQQEFADALAKSLHRPRWLTLPSFVIKLIFGQMGEELLLGSQQVNPTRLLQLNYQFVTPQLQDCLQL